MLVVKKVTWELHDVILLLDDILKDLKPDGIIIRNDNVSHFLAHNVRRYLQERKVAQELTHMATSEESSYIEGFHSNIERELLNRSWLESLFHSRM